MRVVIIRSGALVGDVTCKREAIYVGSREGCRVHLSDPLIPERLAVIYPEGGGAWAFEPLDWRAPVLLNGGAVTGKVTLSSADELQVGDYRLQIFPEITDRPAARQEVATSVVQLTRFAQSQLPPGTIIKKVDEGVAVEPSQLMQIGQVNLSLSQCITVEDLMDVGLQALLELFAAHRAWMGVRRVNYGPMEYVEGRTLTGQAADLPAHGDNYKPRVLDRAQFLLVPRVSVEDRASLLTGPLAVPENTLGMVYIDSGDTGRRFEPTDLDAFVLVADLLAVQLDAIFKNIAKNRAATIDGEVSVAHEIQARITPRKLPQWPQLQFGAFREPGRVRTGDVYDVVRLPNNMAGFMVAHTEATGPLPSMLMAQAQAMFRGAAMHQDGPQLFLRALNLLLYDGRKDHPLNCFVGYVDPRSGEMRYSMAGRTGAYIIGQRGDERSLAPREPTPSLAMVKNFQYPILPEQLAPGETLAVFTPGVTTAKNVREETFGEERFVNILGDGFGQLASNMLKEMFTDLRNFTEGGVQPDDITVLLAHRVG